MKRAVGAKTKAHAPQSALEAVSKALGVEIGDQATATLALTHRSFETEQRVEGLATLRLLGMPVLNLCLTRLVLEELDDMDEVDNKQRAAKLSTVAELADVMQECQLMQHVRVGGGLEQLRLAGSLPATALAEVLLNLIAAAFRYRGLDAAQAVVKHLFTKRIHDVVVGDVKGSLQIRAVALGMGNPEYRSQRTGGLDHAPEFSAEVWVGGKKLASGKGSSIKEAEQQAALRAARKLPQKEAQTPTE